MLNSYLKRFPLLFAALLIVSCTPQPVDRLPGPEPALPLSPTLAPDFTLEASSSNAIGLTHQSLDGNRYVEASGSIPALSPIDIPLAGKPVWLVSIPLQQGGLWAAVLADGQVQAFLVDESGFSPLAISPDRLPPGMPPVLVVIDGQVSLAPLPTADLAQFTHPIPQSSADRWWFIDAAGRLNSSHDGYAQFEHVFPLPDARLLSDPAGRLLFLSQPTAEYDHAILGDALEAASITLLDAGDPARFSSTIAAPIGTVIESLAPIWTDLDGDGRREIIATLTSAASGAYLAVFNESGDLLGASPPIGRGYRWRHQIAAAPFGPQGEMEIAGVLTPHIGGVVEFFRWEGDRLTKTAELAGYTSHIIGSRNLDMSAAVDFDGDGRIELLVPTQDLRWLAALQRTAEGIHLDWQVELGAALSTNLSLLVLPGNSLALGIGLDSGVLRIWYP